MEVAECLTAAVKMIGMGHKEQVHMCTHCPTLAQAPRIEAILSLRKLFIWEM